MENSKKKTSSGELVIKQSQGKQGILIFLGIIMIASCTFLLFEESVLSKIIGIIGILFFGACLIFIVKRFIVPQDIVIVNEKGITDNSSAISLGFIPWEDIKSIYISKILTETFLSIEVYNLDKKLEVLPEYKRKLINANIKMGYAPVSITLNSTKYSPNELLEELRIYVGDDSKFIF